MMTDTTSVPTLDLTTSTSRADGRSDLETDLAATTQETGRGLGIAAGDFVKPDPILTRQETRRVVVAEMRRWLMSDSLRDQTMAIIRGAAGEAPTHEEVASGLWPAGRLYLVLTALECMPRRVTGLPTDMAERVSAVAEWAADVCEDALRGYAAVLPAARLAAGFVSVDRLPSGRTVDSYWNWSPFEALRSAPPLSDGRSDLEEDATVDEAEVTTKSLLDHVFTIRVTGGQLLGAALGLVAYLWINVASRTGKC